MSRASLYTFTLLATVTGVVEAAPPAWCKHPEIYKVRSNQKDALTEPDPAKAIANLVGASCARGNKPADEAALAAARARWNKQLAITDADWASDVVPWAINDGRLSPTFDYRDPPTTQDAISQFARMRGSSVTAGHYSDVYYALDHYGDKLTMSGRMGALERCLYVSEPVLWALCQADSAAFDKTKVFAEMRANTSNRGSDRMTVRIIADGLGAKLAKRAEEIKALVAKDAGYKQLFEIEAQAHKDWAANPPDPALLALVTRIDDAAVSKSTVPGCEESTWKAFADVLGAIPAAKFKDIKPENLLRDVAGLLVNDVNGYLASAALAGCRGTKGDQVDQQLSESMRRWPGYRGPRSMALTRMVTSPVMVNDAVRRNALPTVNRFTATHVDRSGGGTGALAKVTVAGDKTTLEFVAKPGPVEVCHAWQDTGKVEQITTTGAVIYGYTCTKYVTEMINHASPPRTVSSKYTAGVKPGVTVSTTGSVVIIVRPKSGAAPTHVFGVPVK